MKRNPPVENPRRKIWEWKLAKRKRLPRLPALPAGKYKLYWWDRQGKFSEFKKGKWLRGALFIVRLQRRDKKKKPVKKKPPKKKVKRLTKKQKRELSRRRTEGRKKRLLKSAVALEKELEKQLTLVEKRPDLREKARKRITQIGEKIDAVRERKGGKLKVVREALDALKEKSTEVIEEVKIPEPSPDWYPVSQFVQGFIRQLGVNPAAWVEEMKRMNKIPGAYTPEVIYSPYRLMYDRELSMEEMTETKETTSYFFWAVARVSRELDPYISDGHLSVSPAAEGIRMPSPEHKGKRISTADRVVILGCPFTWKAIRGDVRITPAYFHEFVFTIHKQEDDKPFSGQEVWKSVMQSYYMAKHKIYVHPLDDGFVGYIPRSLV